MNKIITKNASTKTDNDLHVLMDKKIKFFQDCIQKTILHIQKNKMLDILGISEVNNCIQLLQQINEKMQNITDVRDTISSEHAISTLQTINNELSGIFKTYGTESLDDLVSICFGNTQTFLTTAEETEKYEIIKKYFHPTGYKVILSKHSDEETPSINSTIELRLEKEKVSQDQVETMKNMDCFDIYSTVKQFHMKVYGMKVYLYHASQKKNLLVYGIIDDIVLKFFNNNYISSIKSNVIDHLPVDIVTNKTIFQIFHEYHNSLSLKDYLINNHQDLYKKFFGMTSQFKVFKQKNLNTIVKDFIQHDLYTKRTTLLNLLIHSTHSENKYIAYLLYDLLSNDTNGSVDTVEQTILFDSFPWSIKDLFRDAMKKTVQYTNDLVNMDVNNKIPLEQQICLMKAPESVKEKAIMKLKEIKSKTDDSGSKARQYLDGLLKIPFQIYRREKIMDVMDEIKHDFQMAITGNPQFPKSTYTGAEIMKFVYSTNVTSSNSTQTMDAYLATLKREQLAELARKINSTRPQKTHQTPENLPVRISNRKRAQIADDIRSRLHAADNATLKKLGLPCQVPPNSLSLSPIAKKFDTITNYIVDVKKTLDAAIHGHDNAKKQIERIIGQWINGEQDGYCFGFEGPPGVGKTSLAKRGLSSCLKDANGEGRPFAMIQMGGDSNGSTLHGHNYTYVGSTWGGIVQILIDKKCMNPIIFIDELDKISRTEHGREIVGILTHLLDPTQNDSFQDKYFSGVDLDLSKALFILSYNDVDSIDKILLDRIHRIKFSSLSLEDKLEIAKTHMLPEIYKKMGMEGLIEISTEVLTNIIEDYTMEPGVRKLREILFEIVGEINLDILKNRKYDYDFPIHISAHDIKTKYFKERQEVRVKKIHDKNTVGVINGLWANALGKGGIIPIQAKFFPCDKFLELKLTGMQGDVMKESMNVALTLAWILTSTERKEQIHEMYNQHHVSKYGVHVHCPEGAVPKDGPSAGAAITTVIYSILNNKKIKNHFAITGEIALDGKVTEIGGLDSKIIGGIKAGITEFIYPAENEKDFSQFMEKYKDSNSIKGVQFHSVSDIHEVFALLFE